MMVRRFSCMTISIILMFGIVVQIVYAEEAVSKISRSYIFGTSVNMRSAPDIASEVLARLNYGDLIDSIEVTSVEYGAPFAGGGKPAAGKAPWVKITRGGVMGYIWQPYICDAWMRADLDRDGVEELVLMKLDARPSEFMPPDLRLWVRNGRSGAVTLHTEPNFADNGSVVLSCKTIRNLSRPTAFINLEGSCYGYNGIYGPFEVYAWFVYQGGRIIKSFEGIIGAVGEGGSMNEQTVIEPDDTGGRKNALIITNVYSEYNDETNNSDVTTKTEYRWWDGSVFR